jgi:hypothetical protein
MTFYMSLEDNPQVLINPARQLKNFSAHPEKPWVQLDKGYRRPCRVRSKLNSSKLLENVHGFLLSPSMGHYAQYHVPLLAATNLDECYADIVVPSYQFFDATER